MRTLVVLGILVGAAGGAAVAAAVGADGAVPADLGAPPLCEASAVLRAPWAPARVIVADNEVDDRLFLFDLVDGRLVGQRPLGLPGRKERAHDVEALAWLGNTLAVVGSHSPGKDGAPRPKRARIAWYARGPADELRRAGGIEGTAALREATRGRDACLAALFVAPPPPLAADVCAAIAAASGAINIEGALALTPPAAPAAAPRLWLGLRAPLADGRAILLRLADPPRAFRFDAAALIDLGARGVRDLAVDDTQLYVIAGGAGDDGPRSRLVRVPRGALQPGALLRPGDAGLPVPDHAEGVLPLGPGEVLVVIDVDDCRTPARQLRVALP